MSIDIWARHVWRAASAGAFLALFAGAASAAFDPPVKLSPPGNDGKLPQVAVAPDGDAFVVWERVDGSGNSIIQGRSRSAAGALGAVQTIAGGSPNATNPQVAIDAVGEALIVWLRTDGSSSHLQARSRSAAGALGPIETLSPSSPPAFDQRVAVAPSGRAIVVWRSANRIHVRARTATGIFGPVRTISSSSPAFSPDVDIADNGAAVAVWSSVEGGTIRVRARARSSSGALGPLQVVSAAGDETSNPDVAVDSSGDALVVWENRTPAGERRIRGRARTASGGLLPIQNLSQPGSVVAAPQVAILDDGDAMVAWTRDDRIQARRRAPNGALSAIQHISPATGLASAPQVAYEENGVAAFVWDYLDGSFQRRVQARARSAVGTLGPIERLAAPGAFSNPQIAAGGGQALAVWETQVAADRRIEASAGP